MSAKFPTLIKRLRSLGNEANRAGMARFGINTERAFGISVTNLRSIAKEVGKDHALAKELWTSGYHEARMLATLIDDPTQVTETQLESWVKDIHSWDLCDGFAGNLVDKTLFAYDKAIEWANRNEEFVRRAGFALMAWLPVHDKKVADKNFAAFFPIIARHASDERNYVKKAVSWALRNLGKRNSVLHRKAIQTAKEISKQDSKAAKWIANDALRELQSEKIRARLESKAESGKR